MNGDNGTSTQAPQMRALLFTDLCDSLILVERIGDAAAAELFQEHDRLVLALQQQWNGRLIDRSDGLLLLFERAIDGLGFALDYQRGLLEIGKQRDIVLRARAGLHVGEVLTWENSPEAIKVGAKSLEVEGLAKPMAARLMTLARPGQILLSAVAESLTYRATEALAEWSERLVWKSHGRWRFKGVPTTQEVFEVGEIGFAPLRMPRSNAKARRDIPLWRQPAALAAEAFLVATLAVGSWMLLRPEPAIAFAERDWVVIGDVQNLTGNVLLDDSLDQAFRISLEQSRFVNVLGDMKVRDTLERMHHGKGMPMDRRAAIQVALRDGAKVVVLPSVVEVHDKLRVAVEVVDPSTAQTVYSGYADGKGLESVLSSTDQVVASLRSRLGETLKSVQRDSTPLPQVTTADLDALRAYALGVTAYSEHRYREALDYFDQAIRIDPDFAFAYIGSMRVHFSQGEYSLASGFYRKALTLRGQMTTREGLYLDAWGREFAGDPLPEVARRWKLLAELYPDYYAGRANYANTLFHMGDYEAALAAAGPLLSSQNPARAMALDFVGRLHLARSNFTSAIFFFNASTSTGGWKGSRQMAAAYAASGKHEAAVKLLRELPDELPTRIERITLLAGDGDWKAALDSADQAIKHCGDTAMICDLFELISLNVRSASGEKVPESAYDVLAARSSAARTGMDRQSQLYIAAAAVYMAQRAGYTNLPKRHLKSLRTVADLVNDRRCNEMLAIIEATTLRSAGKARDAVPLLTRWLDGREQYQLHVALRETYAELGEATQTKAQEHWLAANRGLAYAENAGSYVMQTRNVLDAGPMAVSASTPVRTPSGDQSVASTKQ